MLAVDGVAVDNQYVELDNVSYGATICLRDDVGLTAEVVANAIDVVCTAYRAAYDTESDVLTVIEGLELARPASVSVVVPPSIAMKGMKVGMENGSSCRGFPSASPFARAERLDDFKF